MEAEEKAPINKPFTDVHLGLCPPRVIEDGPAHFFDKTKKTRFILKECPPNSYEFCLFKVNMPIIHMTYISYVSQNKLNFVLLLFSFIYKKLNTTAKITLNLKDLIF